ncbi:MAG: hypothetical protein L0Y58_15350 [Verrucomicrobia subdivision 3 bacterium]|nr:hypothetical protein [Limisphaerales bacterium]
MLIIAVLCVSAFALLGAIIGVARSKSAPPVTQTTRAFDVAAPVSERIQVRQEIVATDGAPAIPAFQPK